MLSSTEDPTATHNATPGAASAQSTQLPHSPSDDGAALILVVDDEPQIVDFLSLLLEDEGYRVRQAYNGRDALRAIRNEPPQLVITDVMMPVGSGMELLRQIDATDDIPAPKVILMSAVAQRVQAPGVPFIQKPFDIEDMLAMVDGALEANSA